MGRYLLKQRQDKSNAAWDCWHTIKTSKQNISSQDERATVRRVNVMQKRSFGRRDWSVSKSVSVSVNVLLAPYRL